MRYSPQRFLVKIENFNREKTEYLTPCGFINSALLAFFDIAICKSVETNLVTFCEAYDRLKISDGYFHQPNRQADFALKLLVTLKSTKKHPRHYLGCFLVVSIVDIVKTAIAWCSRGKLPIA